MFKCTSLHHFVPLRLNGRPELPSFSGQEVSVSSTHTELLPRAQQHKGETLVPTQVCVGPDYAPLPVHTSCWKMGSTNGAPFAGSEHNNQNWA